MNLLEKAELAKYIDHTLLKPGANNDEIKKLCHEAQFYGFASVCVNPIHVELCRGLLYNSGVKIASVIGFPLGATLPNVKFYEAGLAILAGANELDMVINISELKAGNLSALQKEITDIVELANQSNAIIKVIVETSLLTEAEKIMAARVVTFANAHYIKTSTGFADGGATVEDIKLFKANCGENVKIKASGGIKTADFAIELINAGASRIGTSAGVQIMGY